MNYYVRDNNIIECQTLHIMQLVLILQDTANQSTYYLKFIYRYQINNNIIKIDIYLIKIKTCH